MKKNLYVLLLLIAAACQRQPTVLPAAPPAPLPTPESVHLSLGNPTDAKADTGRRDNYLMLKDQYALSYNRSKGQANWVAWELSTDWLGDIDRSDDFRPDPLPADYRQKNMFTDGPDERLVQLSATIDRLNYRFGRDKVRLAATGYDTTWHHKQQWMSPAYTTKWRDILIVK